MQKQYLELAHTYYSTRKMGALAADILQKWEYVLTKLAEDPLQLHREIDWVIKMHMLKTYGERSRMAAEARSDRLLMLDLQYHDIRREKGPVLSCWSAADKSTASFPTPKSTRPWWTRRRTRAPKCAVS